MAKKHVAVLMGGFSSERPISLSSGTACAEAIENLGYKVTKVDVGRDVASRLSELKPDIAFNALHGIFGEDGRIQGILEFLQIPYTHSGVLASALAMDKGRAKIVAAANGVKVAPSRVMNRFEIGKIHPIEPPYVIKPVYEGSSFGVVIVKAGQNTPPSEITGSSWHYGDDVIVEKYVAGRELTCAVLGGEALEVCEIVPDKEFQFYDFQSKYKPGGSKHVCPAPLSPNIYQNVQRMSVAAHQALGCRGVSRSDFRFDEEKGELVWLEINTQPGMTPTSLVPDMAKVAGRSFGDLVKWMLEDASCMR
ncbi:C-terminal [Bartonella apihabitans]|uniref:D-alanine--D-alanine ligase n=1 Tax=Bartonella apihabitans TaxID=2750929 RepID=A0A1U9MCD8_9HYPH|nr:MULTISPECIES: D-alanine--D-alanine ligase [Bartonella]AQT42974.1 D-alanine--D-alanine ligase [Bartonella apihabitans]AQT45212.1 D-alanine--D-alanine ligase [Bartonella apihabitans]MBH9994084.1 D-alanine--D-alanine ligase [Bartonella sp. P0291]MBH9997571.1 D-alanine--D-alanine ligase [Bartonella sp. M0192]MBH9999731.1 D-alanine--D-alanine ligase [Bartonella sp. M0191]